MDANCDVYIGGVNLGFMLELATGFGSLDFCFLGGFLGCPAGCVIVTIVIVSWFG